VGALDRELAESLEEFEVAMAGEQVRVAGQDAEQRDSGGSGAELPSGGGSAGGYPSEIGGGGQPTREQSSGTTGESSENAPTGGPGGVGGSAPPDVGDGSDDDIVARQLREAAEKETDPELREKLWDEYRAYKNSVGQ
jgi:hypothetical protein